MVPAYRSPELVVGATESNCANSERISKLAIAIYPSPARALAFFVIAGLDPAIHGAVPLHGPPGQARW
jgi:hypothetical protein